MSPEEHYFENLLFKYARDGHVDYVSDLLPLDSNLSSFSYSVRKAIEACATYVIECCGWDKEVLDSFLNSSWITSEKLSSR